MLKQRPVILAALFCLAIVWLSSSPGFMAQTPQATTTPPSTPAQPTPQTPRLDCDAIKKEIGLSKSPDFVEITDARDEVTSDIARLEQEITELTEQIAFAPTAQQIEAERQLGEREKLASQKANTSGGAEKSSPKADFVVNVPSQESLKQELKVATDKLNARKLQARCIQQSISSIHTPEQSFKTTVSVYFAILIGLVIVGFFILSFKDETIRRAIFSGQTGIQFLTLFSIVIAIILFGVTNILQDKELAALLGGLSGYILGRYSMPPENRSNASEPPPPSQNPPAGTNPP